MEGRTFDAGELRDAGDRAFRCSQDLTQILPLQLFTGLGNRLLFHTRERAPFSVKEG